MGKRAKTRKPRKQPEPKTADERARRFLKLATELDAHEQRLRLIEEAMVLLAARADMLF